MKYESTGVTTHLNVGSLLMYFFRVYINSSPCVKRAYLSLSFFCLYAIALKMAGWRKTKERGFGILFWVWNRLAFPSSCFHVSDVDMKHVFAFWLDQDHPLAALQRAGRSTGRA
jgi:hypothetical protein